MSKRVLGLVSPWVRWPWPLASPPRNFAARTRRRVRAMAFTPALTPSLVVSRRKVWPGVTGQRRHLRIGAGVIGADHTDLNAGFRPGALSDLDVLGSQTKHRRECHSRVSPVADHGLRPARLARRAVSKEPQTLLISQYGSAGFLAVQRSAAFPVATGWETAGSSSWPPKVARPSSAEGRVCGPE